MTQRPIPLFAYADYRRGWFLGLLTGVVRWLEFLALGILAYQLTESPPLVALLAIFRLAPYALFGYLVGTLTDKIDRRRWLLIGLFAMMSVSAAMTCLAMTEHINYSTIVLATLCTGLFWLTDMPIRRRVMLDAVGSNRAGRAMGIDNITNYATRGLGPLVGGVAFQWFGATGVFSINFCLYLVCLILATGFQQMKPADVRQSEAEAASAHPNSPRRHLLSDTRFCLTLGITVIYNLFCTPFLAMLPVFARKDFDLTPAAVGTLAAFEGVGGLIGSIVIGLFIRPSAFFGIYFAGPLVYLLSMLALSFMLTPSTTLLALIAVGTGGAFFSATQYALIYTTTPPDARGRAFGFLSLGIGCGTLGLMNAGLVFKTYESAMALQILALEGLGLLLCLGVFAIWRRLSARR
ncbi:MAG: MFS transporter [Hyphomicrobiaceae bacterium]